MWAEVHDSAKDMISHMMVVDPTQRWPARDLLNHKWFQVRGSGSQQPHKLEPSADIVFKKLHTCSNQPWHDFIAHMMPAQLSPFEAAPAVQQGHTLTVVAASLALHMLCAIISCRHHLVVVSC
mgnify:CR=1 FL=1